jgi:hypothetical protein
MSWRHFCLIVLINSIHINIWSTHERGLFMFQSENFNYLIFPLTKHVQLEDTLFSHSRNLRDQITNLSQKVMRMISNVYKEGVRQGKFREGHSMAHADIVWSMFTGLVIWEESKRKINPRKDFLKPTLDKAFDIFCRGIMRGNGKKH